MQSARHHTRRLAFGRIFRTFLFAPGTKMEGRIPVRWMVLFVHNYRFVVGCFVCRGTVVVLWLCLGRMDGMSWQVFCPGVLAVHRGTGQECTQGCQDLGDGSTKFFKMLQKYRETKLDYIYLYSCSILS